MTSGRFAQRQELKTVTNQVQGPRGLQHPAEDSLPSTTTEKHSRHLQNTAPMIRDKIIEKCPDLSLTKTLSKYGSRTSTWQFPRKAGLLSWGIAQKHQAGAQHLVCLISSSGDPDVGSPHETIVLPIKVRKISAVFTGQQVNLANCILTVRPYT